MSLHPDLPTAAPAASDLVRLARIGGGALCVLVLLLVGVMLWSDYRHEYRRSSLAVDNLTRAVEQQFWMGLRDVEAGMRGLANELAPLLPPPVDGAAPVALDDATLDRVRLLLGPASWHQASGAVALVAADGRVLASHPHSEQGSYVHLPPRLGGQRSLGPLAIGAPEFVEGRWILPMAVPVLAERATPERAAAAAYWVAGSIDVGAATSFLVHFNLGEEGVAIIRHRDGAVVARAPGFPGTTAETVLPQVPATFAEHEQGSFVWTWQLDDTERLFGHRGGHEFPFTVLVGRSTRSLLSTWREGAWLSGGALLAMMLGWLGVYALLERAHRRQQAMAAQLETQSLALLEAQRMGSIGHWELDVGNNRCEASEEALRILGRGQRHLAAGPLTLFGLVHADDQAALLAGIEHAATAARPIDMELRVLHPDSQQRTLQLRGERVAGIDGRTLVAGTVQDVSEWAEARDSLRSAESQYRFLFDRNPLPMCVYDRETLRFLAVNDASVRHYGYSRAEFLERSILDVHVAEDVPQVIEVVRSTSPEGRAGLVWRQRKRSGEEIQVMTHSVETEFGGRPARIVLCVDVTDRLLAEAQRSESELRFSVVARAASDAIYDWCAETDQAWWSEGFAERFGHPSGNVVRLADWGRLLHPDDAGVALELEQRMRGPDTFWETSYRFQRADGSYADVVGSAHFLRAADGRLRRMIGSIVDVSAKRRDEAQLRLLQRAIDSTDNGIIVAAVDGGRLPVMYVNPAFERMSGYRAVDLLQCDLSADCGCTAQPPTLLAMRDAIASGSDGQSLVRGENEGVEFWNELHVTAVRSDNGSVTQYVGIVADVSERERSQRQLAHRATHDALTGLPNRLLVMQRIVAALRERLADDSDVALMFIDLDHFKLINDTLGHETGDRMLKIVAERLQAAVPDADTIGRFGGDEFVVVMREQRGDLGAEGAAERILAALTRPLDGVGTLHYLTPSIGFARCGDDIVDSEALLRRADMAMYEAKKRGRNCAVAFSEEFETAVTERLHLVSRLREALEKDEFELAFQPQYCAETGSPVGLEALIRWRHPERGLLAPGAFIGVAEESGLIIPIGRWVLYEAARYHRLLSEAGWPQLTIAVNVSADQFLRGELLADVEAAMTLHRVRRGALELELTESVVLADPDAAIATMHTLREQGVTLAIDDFGTGYSSLNYLRELPADRLKLDRAFVADLGRDPKAAKICVTIMRLAQSLGLKVVAEGVEEWSQFEWLRENGCDEVQGYCFARPLAFHDTLAVLARGRIASPRTAVA